MQHVNNSYVPTQLYSSQYNSIVINIKQINSLNCANVQKTYTKLKLGNNLLNKEITMKCKQSTQI